jgi:hypothetical protein
MKTRDERIAEEAAALWRELFGAAPPAGTDGAALLKAITGKLPDMRCDRMRSPFLRASLITSPRGEGGPA